MHLYHHLSRPQSFLSPPSRSPRDDRDGRAGCSYLLEDTGKRQADHDESRGKKAERRQPPHSITLSSRPNARDFCQRCPDHSSLMLANFTTLAHFSDSAVI
jgi:hypothetical protein